MYKASRRDERGNDLKELNLESGNKPSSRVTYRESYGVIIDHPYYCRVQKRSRIDY